MANKDDYLTSYREFFEYFAKTVNPNDQLPVKLGSYKLLNMEVIGGIIDWTSQYLSQKKCPPHLFSPLIKIVIEEIRKACKKDPLKYGFNDNDNAYEPLKLMQAVMAKTNEVCLRFLDNSVLCSLPAPSSNYYKTSISSTKNKRRTMEDRHVVIHDLSTMFNIEKSSPSSYYAVFDGHAGHDAAAYSAAHLHQYLAENKHFVSNPEQALMDAFCKTDSLYMEKCRVESLGGGTTAVVALLRPKEKTLYVAWVGDSQALLVKEGSILQCVQPHKPSRQDERERIEKAGGSVIFWGTWRVNGVLAVSRAIGDASYKPFVMAIPDVKEIPLEGNEDFLILACDGLWDFLSEEEAAQKVYYMITENPDDTERISKRLVQLACNQSSTDNISVIVVFLRDPHHIAAETQHWTNKKGPLLTNSNMETGLDNANNPFTNSNGSLKNLDVNAESINLQKSNDGLLLNLTDNFKANGADDIFVTEKSNGTKKVELNFDDDFGPETNVDTVDDALSPQQSEKSFAEALVKGLKDENVSRSFSSEVKAYSESLANNNPLEGAYNPFLDQQNEEKANIESKEIDFDDIHGDQREETPTPPTDAVQDDGGLEENPVESDSEEDEWNYIKGDQAKSDNLSSQPETVVEAPEQEETMSQLNPNAAEFVPVSPTRSIPSPVCRALIDDEVIAQSPKRPGRVDINVPSETEFEFEVKSRPSEVENGHNSETSNSTPERVDHLLNGKSLEEIPEFHPASTPAKLPTDEFHFGPNSAPFAPRTLLDQSETALSTQAEYGDDTRHTLNTSINDSELTEQNHETDDPMSMSFYAEKGDSNPFQEDKDDNDLNKIHKLPDNLEEFLKDTIDANKENFSFNDTISDLPEHNPLGRPLDNDRALIQTTDLDKISQDDEKELESPLENRELMDTHPDNNLVTLEPQQINLNVPSTEESNAIIDIDIHGVTPLAFIQTTQESDQAATLLADLKIETQDSLPSQQNNESNILPKPEPSVPESSEINEFIRNEQSLASEDLCSFNPFQSKNQPQFETISIDASPLCQYPVADSTSDTNAFSPGGLQESELLQEQKMEDDITCSIKDDISSPIEQSSNASAFDDFARESATVNTTENCNEVPIEVNAQEILADLASDVPSPIVNIEQNAFEPRVTNDAIIPGAGVTVNGFDNSVEVFNEQISIKTENIAPEFAESAILTPSEEGRVNEDLSVSSPIVNQTECLIEQILEHQPEITQPVEPVASQIQPEAAALPTITLVHSTPEVKTKDKKDIKAPLLGKKPIGKVEPRKTTSPKVGVAKPSSKPSNIASKTGVPSRDPIKSGISKTAAPIPAKTTSNVKSPRVPSVPKTGSTATASKTIETKISSTTANLKAAPRVPISKRPIYESIATRTTTRPATAAAAAKPSPTKPTTTRPATAPRTLAPKPASNSATTKPLTGAKPRVPLASRTTSTAAPTTVKSTLAAASKTLAATKPASPKTSSVVSPKPRTIASAAPPKPRVPSTKTVTKSADFDKEKKDSANKLTASRSAVSRTITSTAARTTSSTVTKTEIKSLSNRTVAARTTTTTRTTTLGKQPVSKTKTTKIEKPKENGVAPTNITEEINEINVVNNIVNQSETETLLKDNSPVNNRLLLDNPLVDPNPE